MPTNDLARRLGSITVAPSPAAEHPMRCAATTDFGGDHEHACIHPAQRPDQTDGVPEHRCHCGATWWEPKIGAREARLTQHNTQES